VNSRRSIGLPIGLPIGRGPDQPKPEPLAAPRRQFGHERQKGGVARGARPTVPEVAG